jgi:hypothetical protein
MSEKTPESEKSKSYTDLYKITSFDFVSLYPSFSGAKLQPQGDKLIRKIKIKKIIKCLSQD